MKQKVLQYILAAYNLIIGCSGFAIGIIGSVILQVVLLGEWYLASVELIAIGIVQFIICGLYIATWKRIIF